MAGSTPRELAAEFGCLRRQRPGLAKVVAHLILCHDPTQRPLTKSEWKEAIQIALHTHGADEASFAAWRHGDKSHQHAHVIFSRVLTTNQVVSDSHSFRKNEAAARLIESKFMLNAPTPTPEEDRPGDRQAKANAGRRAERRGTADPTKISPQTVRDALSEVNDFADLPRRMGAAGLEIEFDRRGKDRSIFGWRVRRAGAEEWMKASSIHKDLSWPKISHRFAELEHFVKADAAEQIAADQVVLSVPPAPQAPRTDLDRMPAVARNVLAPAVKESLEESDTALNAVSRRLGELGEQQSSPLLMTGLVIAKLGVMCLQLSAAAARALWAFILRLLAAFGVGVREVRVTTPAAPLQLAPVVTPSPASTQVLQQPYLLPQANTIDSVDSVAAATLEHVLDCVQTRRVSDLPKIGDGQENERAALVAALEDDSTATSGALSAGAGAAATPDQFEPLFIAISSYTTAKHAHDVAPKVESVEVRNARVKVGMASQNLLKSQTRFQREHPNLFLLGRMKKHTVGEIAAVAEAQRAFHQAKIDFPHAPDLSLIADANRKAMAFLLLARKAVQHLKDQQSLIRDQQISKYASSSITRLQKAITEFKNGNGEEAISMIADRSLSEVNKFVEDDRSQSRRKEINARLAAAAAAAAEESTAAADAAADDDEEPPRA